MQAGLAKRLHGPVARVDDGDVPVICGWALVALAALAILRARIDEVDQRTNREGGTAWPDNEGQSEGLVEGRIACIKHVDNGGGAGATLARKPGAAHEDRQAVGGDGSDVATGLGEGVRADEMGLIEDLGMRRR